MPFGEQLMLWSVRLWMRGTTNGTQDFATLRNGFKLAGVPSAHTVLDGLMTVITTAATDPIDIRCPNCRDISDDEHLLIDVIAGLQHPGRGGATLFACRLPPAARRMGMDWAGELARTLAGAGLMLRPREVFARAGAVRNGRPPGLKQATFH